MKAKSRGSAQRKMELLSVLLFSCITTTQQRRPGQAALQKADAAPSPKTRVASLFVVIQPVRRFYSQTHYWLWCQRSKNGLFNKYIRKFKKVVYKWNEQQQQNKYFSGSRWYRVVVLQSGFKSLQLLFISESLSAFALLSSANDTRCRLQPQLSTPPD